MASHFGRRGPRGRRDLDVSWSELVWCAITVGKWRNDLFAHGRYSYFEAMSRAALHWAYLRSTPSGRLVRTNAYNDLDPTEKAGVSYAIGMSTAKLFAARQLGTPWLVHVDRYRVQFGVSLQPGRSRPDLVGPRDANLMRDWIVVEAKGRTNNLDSYAIDAMRLQKGRVLTIGGHAPFLYVGSAAHFSSGELEVRAVDPPAKGRRPVEFFADEYDDIKRRFAGAYYGPLVEILQEEETEYRSGLVVRDLPLADVSIGMTHDRFQLMQEYLRGDQGDMTMGASSAGDLALSDDRQHFLGADGVVVELGDSWSERTMMLQPLERVS